MCDQYLLVTNEEYQRLLQNFGKSPEETKPETIAISVDCNTEPKQIENSDYFLNFFDSKQKVNAEKLLSAIKQKFTGNELTWDSKTGIVSIKGQPLEKSEISDIIRVLISTRAPECVPALSSILQLFKESNFPQLLIKNPKVRKLLCNQVESDLPEKTVKVVRKQIAKVIKKQINKKIKKQRKSTVWVKWC